MADTDALDFTRSELMTASSDDSELESEDSFASRSYEEEDLYSSESEMATAVHSNVVLEEVGPSFSSLSLDLLEGRGELEQPGTPQCTKQEIIRQIHLRQHIDGLRKNLNDKETKVEEIRLQLVHCREHLNSLLRCQSDLQAQVTGPGGDKAASLGLLRSQLDKVAMEVDSERNVELNIQNDVRQGELELCEAQAAMGRFEESEVRLVEGEEVTKEVKMRQAVKRLQAENKLVVETERARKAQERFLCETQRDHEAQTRALVEEARETQEKGRQFLHATIGRRRREEAAKEEKERVRLDKRVKALLSLKKNIDSSHSTLLAQQMLKSEGAKKKAVKDRIERERILSEGGNPDQAFLRKQRIESFELSKEAFLKKQNEGKVEIINKLLEEEKILKKSAAKSHSHSPQESSRKLSKLKKTSKTNQLSTTTHEEVPTIRDPEDKLISVSGNDEPVLGSHGLPSSHGDGVSGRGDGVSGRGDGVSGRGDGEAILVEPDIRGLWDQGHGSVSVVKRERSKVEVEMMEEALDKLKRSNITKQVVAGREFKGQAFTSKPAEVVFKDFDVGQSYRRKVTLTNVSYSFNYCKLVGVTDNLMDFLSVEFNPPGSMSAGLTCAMVVTFEPKLNEDIHGHIEMLSQTGPFTLPVACLTKKCLISADCVVVDFGRVCVGETVHKTVTLTNTGALSTNFKFISKSQLLQPSLNAPTESVGEELVSTGPLSDKSVHSIMSNVDPRSSRMDTLTVGGAEGKMTRSVGDLSCVSHKSLTWAIEEAGGEVPNQELSDDTHKGSHRDGESKGVPEVPCAFSVGGVGVGEIAGFSSVGLELVYSPTTPSQERSEFIVTFSHPSVPPLVLTGVGCGGELPVWLKRETMDLRVCVLDRLYQDTITLHNRASTALRVTFRVPPSLQPYMEVLPKYGVVQGESSYSAQLKFTPKASILEWEELTEEGALIMPVEVHVVDQTQPLLFTVSAMVTPSELTFDRDSIDFGPCTTHESVVATLHMTNTSLLAQSFGFLSLPAFVDVQPGDGLGEILPQETLALDLVFSARKPREYSFELTIKTALDKTYKIPCRGVGVLPALELSHNAINFSATALGDSATTSIRVSNPQQGRLSSAVIRGALLPQGPKMYEFSVPPGCPFTVSPQVGEVPLGESVSVSVVFSPCLDPGAVREEAVRMVQEELLRATQETARLERERIELERQQQSAKKKGKKPAADTPKLAQRSGLLSASRNSLSSPQPKVPAVVSSSPEPPEEGSDLWRQAEQTLLRQFTDLCLQMSIPCFVSSETFSTTSLDTPAHRVEDTLYLEVTAPMVRPALVLDTDHGNTSIDYESVGTGDSKTKMIAIKNISDHVLKLQGSVLDPHGPFEQRNALKELSPGQSRNLIIRFSPLKRGKFCEHLVLTYNDTSHLRLKLSGTGVQPDVRLTPDTNTYDLGHAMVRDTVSGVLQLTNHSPLAVRYQLSLESSLPGAAERRKKEGRPFRASNFSGAPPFVCVQTEGVIEGGGGCSELTILFSPDHQSSAYRDTAYIDINGQRKFTIQLKAKAWTNNMYVCLPDEPPPLSNELNSEESMAASPPLPGKKHPAPVSLVLLFTHHLSSVGSGDSLRVSSANEGGLKKGGNKGKANTITISEVSDIKVERELAVGCIKSSLVKKTSGDFSIDALSSSHPHSKYFTISPLKMSVESGSTKTVLVTFSPPRDTSLSTVQATTNMTLKGDTSQVYHLLLRGLICE